MNEPIASLNYDPADPDKMRLPAGITCGDCVHIHRCKAMFGHVEVDTSCDWSPSRFHRAAAAGRCRICGCTEMQACPGGCYWVEPDLCSVCHRVIERPK